MKSFERIICVAAVLALSACDNGGNDPMGGDDAGAMVDLDAGAPDATVPVGDGGVSLGGCEAGEPCRCPMAERDGHPYILCPDAVDHQTAQAACASAGFRLVTVDSAEEQDWIWSTSDSMFVEGAKDVWIGLDDRDEEGTYVWSDGTPLGDYANWAEDQPDNGASGEGDVEEDCTEMNTYFEGKWNDLDCGTAYLGFVCEG